MLFSTLILQSIPATTSALYLSLAGELATALLFAQLMCKHLFSGYEDIQLD